MRGILAFFVFLNLGCMALNLVMFAMYHEPVNLAVGVFNLLVAGFCFLTLAES